MKRTRWMLAVPTTVVALGIGFILPEILLVASGRLAEAQVSLSNLPTEVSQAVTGSERTSLPPVTTYWETLNRINNQYVGAADNKQLTYAAVRGMLASLHDPFTRFMNPAEYKAMQEDTRGDFFGIGAQLQEKKKEVIIFDVIENSPAQRAGVKPRDVIVKVDGKPVAGQKVDEIVKQIRGPRQTKVTITVHRPSTGQLITIPIIRDLIVSPVAKAWMEDPKTGVGRVALYQFNDKADQMLVEKINGLRAQGMKALILDLRNNPGGLLNVAIDVTSRFVDGGPVVLIQEKSGRRFTLNAVPSMQEVKEPMVVLINEFSASASEIVSGALRDAKRATLVGETTYGKGLVQTVFQLPGDSAAAITTAKYFTPSGQDINRKVDPDGKELVRGGIHPDIEVKPSDKMEDMNDRENDLQLKRAVSVLNEQLARR